MLPFEIGADMATLPPLFRWVHGPLAHWAKVQPNAVALDNGHQRLTFADLHHHVQQRAHTLCQTQMPGTILLHRDLGVLDTLLEFLAVVASGRCAAIGDPAWPDSVAQTVQAAMATLSSSTQPTPASNRQPTDAFYIGFTSGSTGQPKGFRRHHQSWVESFRVSLHDWGRDMATCMVAPGRMTHSLFLFGALMGLWTGAGAVVQERFSAEQTLLDLALRPKAVLVAVPSQLLLMIQIAQRKHLPPMPQVCYLLISGARWMREHTPSLRQLFPNARIMEFYGASETSYVAWMQADTVPDATAARTGQAVGRPFSNVQLRIGAHPETPVPTGQTGRIWVRSPMLFMDYVHAADDSAAIWVNAGTESDPQRRWLSVRDVGWLDAQGLLHLCGRENRMMVTQGKNLFPEEVETRLLAHPMLAQASVQGVPDTLRGMCIHAVLQRHPDQSAQQPRLDTLALHQWCCSTLESYKAPRHWWLWQGPWPMTRSGKTDHAVIAKALEMQSGSQPSVSPIQAVSLQTWP